MTHYDDRLPGSIGGIPVFFEKSEPVAGRRTVVHEYYGRDTPSVEDVGKATYRSRMTVFITGPEYNRTREEIFDMLNEEGPWELVDPWYGVVDVHLDGEVKLTEGLMHEGMMRIGQLAVVEAGEPSPITISDSLSLVPVLIGIALDELALNTTFSLEGIDIDTGAPYSGGQGILNSIASALFGVAGMLAGVNGKINGMLGKVKFIGAAFDDLAGEIAELKSSPQRLMGALHELVNSVMGFVDEFRSDKKLVTEEPPAPLSVAVSFAMAEMTAHIVEPEPEPDGPQRKIEVAAHEEIALQTKAAAVLTTSSIVGGVSFESASQSVVLASKMAEVYDEVLASPDLPPRTFSAIAAARSATMKLMRDQAALLPRIESVTTAVPIPALVLAHTIYGDSSRALELARRNGVEDPGWVPAGDLEVLGDA